MLEKISYEELLDWMAYAEVEPWPDVRADWNNAYIVASIQNLFTKPGAVPKPISNFLLKFDTRPANSWQHNKANLLQHLGMAQELTKREQHG